ncbi:hypothetical protein WMY93_032300 [Mugilogobius chulae]|uniref:tRNA-splicing endonuclease subunit Sen2 n=1 Tax=Mugilogobius chulae TaxID=88201 RepID=A0AAW0MPL3_9GOBI
MEASFGPQRDVPGFMKSTRTVSPEPGPEPDQLRADLINQQVLVQNPDHIRTFTAIFLFLFQGFFGKGVLSKSAPVHSVSDKWENVEGRMLPVVSSSRYEELLRWAGQTLSAQGLDEAAVSHRLQQFPQREPDQLRDLDRDWNQAESTRARTRARTKSGPGPEQSQSQGPRLDSDLFVFQGRAGPKTRPDSRPDSRPGSGPGPGFSVPGSGFVLVQSDSESQIRRVPISVTEFLQLSHEEAFFLVFALGVLTVYHRQVPLSILQLWRTFRSFSSDFVSFYSAFHFYRSKGWIPKTGSGAKYGSDLMLYRKVLRFITPVSPSWFRGVQTLPSLTLVFVGFRGVLCRRSAESQPTSPRSCCCVTSSSLWTNQRLSWSHLTVCAASKCRR